MARTDGFTEFTKGNLAIPSGLILMDTAGVEYVLWFNTSGALMTTTKALAEAAGYAWNSSGTKVGAQ